jgi:hypothetical protein
MADFIQTSSVVARSRRGNAIVSATDNAAFISLPLSTHTSPLPINVPIVKISARLLLPSTFSEIRLTSLLYAKKTTENLKAS